MFNATVWPSKLLNWEHTLTRYVCLHLQSMLARNELAAGTRPAVLRAGGRTRRATAVRGKTAPPAQQTLCASTARTHCSRFGLSNLVLFFTFKL